MSKLRRARARVIADLHLSHAGVTRFLRRDGTKLRPWDTPEEMDAEIIRRWNAVVEPHDRVYVLGDVVMNKRALPVLEALNGKMVLIPGNHDIFKATEYLKYFEDIRGYKVVDGPDGPRAILSHIPIHAECLGRYQLNIHGHLHSNSLPLKLGDHDGPRDPRYVCVSAEQIDYTPVLLENVIAESGVVDTVGVEKFDGVS